MFTSGFVLGTVGSYYCFFKHQTVIKKKCIQIKIIDNNGVPIIKDYHYNSSNETIVFKESLTDVKISIKFGQDEDVTLDKFSGSHLNLKKLHTGIIKTTKEEDPQL